MWILDVIKELFLSKIAIAYILKKMSFIVQKEMYTSVVQYSLHSLTRDIEHC